MRYKDSGEVHKDFHLGTNQTINHIMAKYGSDFLSEWCRRTAQLVYADIYSSLKKGDYAPLIEHLIYYFNREHGEYLIEEGEDGASFIVAKCPMISHITGSGNTLSPYMGEFLSQLYGSWGEDTPFTITVAPGADGYESAVYTIEIRRAYAAE